jgi:hypothetical protein
LAQDGVFQTETRKKQAGCQRIESRGGEIMTISGFPPSTRCVLEIATGRPTTEELRGKSALLPE